MRQMLVDLLPNCLAPLIVRRRWAFPTPFSTWQRWGTSGMGTQPPTPECGAPLLSDVLQFAQSAWWVVTFPGVAILLSGAGI